MPLSTRPTIMSHLWPFTPIELGEGFVIGKEKVLTKASGRFKNGANANATVYVYVDCVEIAAVKTADTMWRNKNAIEDRNSNHEGATTLTVPHVHEDLVKLVPGEVTIQLQPGHIALVVWEVPSTEVS